MVTEYCADVGAETFRTICDSAKDTEGLSVIHHAAMRGKTEMCKYLIETVKVNVKEKAGDCDIPLIVATRADQIPTATYLLNHGADVNESNIKGVTALHAASSYGHTKFMKLLIAKGAQVEANSDIGTPLVSAVGAGKKEAVMLLLDHGANPNSTPSSPINPLMLSVAISSFDCVNLLVKAGADTNALMFGKGPLSLAVSKSEIEIVKFLLKAGANPNLAGTTGTTPLEYAAMEANNEMVMILLPVTSRIPTVPVWSLDGIMSYFNSEEVNEERERKWHGLFQLAKQKGGAAVKRKDYLNAMCCYSEAYMLFPNDAAVLSNRSLCYARLNDGKQALSDAQACVKWRPDWPKAHYREGVAWTLQMDYAAASHSFSEALKLDPENEEIRKALKEAESHKSREAELHKYNKAVKFCLL